MAWERLPRSYDVAASAYEDRFADELDHKPADRALLAAFAAASGDPVIDVGAGPGQVGAFVRGLGRRTVGADLSWEMSRLAAARLDGAVTADLRSLPLASGSVGGLLAFYSIIHVPRPELPGVLGEFRRVLRPGGRLLISAHEGEGETTNDDFLGQGVPFIATLFSLDELTAAAIRAGLDVTTARRRAAYPDEHPTVRLYVEAVRSSLRA